jgi:hypothetical protein
MSAVGVFLVCFLVGFVVSSLVTGWLLNGGARTIMWKVRKWRNR